MLLIVTVNKGHGVCTEFASVRMRLDDVQKMPHRVCGMLKVRRRKNGRHIYGTIWHPNWTRRLWESAACHNWGSEANACRNCSAGGVAWCSILWSPTKHPHSLMEGSLDLLHLCLFNIICLNVYMDWIRFGTSGINLCVCMVWAPDATSALLASPWSGS
jgi:hypothetical protein